MDPTQDFSPDAPPQNLRAAVGAWAEADLANEACRDQVIRWQVGERVWVEDYLALIPGLGSREEVVLNLIENELFLRREAGEVPLAEEYRQRFHHHWAALEKWFSMETVSAIESDAVRRRIVGSARRNDVPDRIGRYSVVGKINRGGFGVVYRGRDELLAREVAIKVPHLHRMTSPELVQAFLSEAQILAQLSHPGIVPVFDFGQMADGRCYLVSKLVSGGSLADRLAAGRMTPAEAAEVVAATAEALHFAHQSGLVHRDIKPANILLEADGQPVVADFGLALREEDYGRGPTSVGTPAYMSPEQARGEGHLVDARTDVYSLGVVLYELLTGERPFWASDKAELLELVIRGEPRPPRQLDDTIPRELDRICVKAMGKRASDRHSTALDLAEDLRQWNPGQRTTPPAEPLRPALPLTPPANLATSTSYPSSSSRLPASILPRGLRSFESEDADFFLDLLPGPRGRGGLPESIRFWKGQLETTDDDRACRVGLIYGPSGCGKSSLVKAGLLPRLAEHVGYVYVEATAGDTAARLLKGLRKRCPTLPLGIALTDALTRLRRGRDLPAGGKLVIVLDQFEQWLHTHPNLAGEELVAALRQCDGGRIQALLLVRDDFWMGVSRFLRELEVSLQDGRNSTPIDLFDPRHARKVLTGFGRAYGALPEGDLTPDQGQFLDRAVAGLAEGGKIIPVRLALFAEMVKDKPWTPATWHTVGGAEGVGVAFLEETFGARTAPARYRVHQGAARAVLERLMPRVGVDIKGPMQSPAELLAVSGYANRPADFDDLLRILDAELRLVTTADPDSTGDESQSPGPDRQRYQLTHDYLVPALRQWLTRKQRETRRGRAELRLEELAAAFTAQPETRHLPSWWEWAQIRLLTRKREWTPAQRAMMRRATRFHGRRAACVFLVVALLTFGGWEYHVRSKVHTLRNRLLTAVTADVPGIMDEMAPYRGRIDPLLREADAEAEASGDARKRLNVSLALLPSDPGKVDYLTERLLDAWPEDFATIRGQLAPHKDAIAGRFWAELESPSSDPDRRFRAAGALALYAPDDARWATAGAGVAAKLATESPLALSTWIAAFRPVRRHLLPPLGIALQDEKAGFARRRTAATLYREFATEADLDGLETALRDPLGPGDADAAKRRANLATALVAMGRGEKVWPLLIHTPDPTLRGYLIERLGASGADRRLLESRLKTERDVSARRALILVLGGYEQRLPSAERLLLDQYENDPDPGVHSAAEWVLRRWGQGDQLRAIDGRLATGRSEGGRQWLVTPGGKTLTIVQPGRLKIRTQRGGVESEKDLKIDHRFAIATKEMTIEEFQKFRDQHKFDRNIAPDALCPANSVSWYTAAAYCNWLSDREGIPESEWCYKPNDAGEYADGMYVARDIFTRKGYRLPMVNEWQFASAAGATTPWPCGHQDLLTGYAWLAANSAANSIPRTWPVGTLKPNDLGLFDTIGNVAEWCQNEHAPPSEPPPSGSENFIQVTNQEARGVAGGAYLQRPAEFRLPGYLVHRPESYIGFRTVRTVP